MPTEFLFAKVVRVVMLDKGEVYEVEPIHWEDAEAQDEAALEQADEQDDGTWVLMSKRGA